MALDPLLYVAFGIGLVAGRWIRVRSPWVGRATLVTVVLLLLLLGASLGPIPLSAIADAIPLAVAFAALLLAVTVGLTWVFRRRAGPPPEVPPPPQHAPRRFPIEGVLVAAVILGYAILGRFSVPWGVPLEGVLYLLLALVAFELEFSRDALRTVWRPLGAALLAAPIAAGAIVVLTGLSAPVAFATAFGFGWYTLAGPLVASKAGAALGLVAFLTNFLRENATMVSARWVGPHVGGEAIAAMGGATSMDTTLYFSVRYGGPGTAAPALATGLVLTVAASLLLPLLLALPGA